MKSAREWLDDWDRNGPLSSVPMRKTFRMVQIDAVRELREAVLAFLKFHDTKGIAIISTGTGRGEPIKKLVADLRSALESSK